MSGVTDPILQPVRALLERLGLPLAPTLSSTGTFEALGAPAWAIPTVTAADEPAPTSEDAPTRIGRLIVKHELGRGGMGAVYAAHDPELARDVAVKVVRDQGSQGAARIARFVSEAQITGQLEHPSIVPVHEIGVTPQGGLYYVMKRLRGQSLRQLLDALADGAAEQWTLHRLLSVFVQVCDAVAFAHSRGVIHRDLKPENLMVGEFGEVLVVDWGLAALLGAHNPYEPPLPQTDDGRVVIPPIRRSTSSYTEDGATLGSPGYMAPEQARGEHERLAPAADVFSLGCVLFELLTLRRAYVADNALQLMFALMSGPPEPPTSVTPERRIPGELSDIALWALATEPEDRPAHAGALADAVRAWLDGSARRRAALTHLAEARARWKTYLAVRTEQAALAERERALDEATPAWTPMEDKAELLTARDRLSALGNERLSAFSSFVTACDQARAKDPESSDAAALLAQGWWTRLLEAEDAGDAGRVRWCEDRVREQAPEAYAERLEGRGSLSLRTDPPGATVTCQRFSTDGIVWGLSEPEVLGTTPLQAVPLAMGSYRLTLERPGFAPVTYPVFIRRAEHWEAQPVPLLTAEQIGAQWAYVPAGPFLSCGDPSALEARPSTRPHVPGFLIRTLPLSLRDYRAFVNDLHRRDPERAWQHVPGGETGVSDSGGKYWPRPAPGEEYVIPAVDRDGDRWDENWPVFGISWHHAQACAAWASEQLGEAVALPSLLQWEKAARGVDGRIWPWGNRFDATLAHIRHSQQGRPQPRPVGSVRSDVSVYGVRDVAGSIRELCGDASFHGNDQLRPVVGASWNHLPDAARCASRLGTSHWNRSAFMGFRFVRALPTDR